MEQKIPVMDNERIPDKSSFRRAFRKIEANPDGEYDEMMKIYLDAFDSYPIVPLTVPHEGTPHKFIACRVISEEEFNGKGLDKYKDKLTSFSHPPAEVCRQQRFNIKGTPALYAASSEHTAIAEKLNGGSFKEGDSYYLSTWELKHEVPLRYIMLFYGKTITEEYKEIYEMLDRRFELMFRYYTKDKRKSLKYFLQRLTDLTLKEASSGFTAALGHYYFNNTSAGPHPPVRYIEYPSVKKNRSGLNYAISPQLIQEGALVCTGVKKKILRRHSPQSSFTTTSEIGTVEGEEVIWKNFAIRFKSAEFISDRNESFLKLEDDELKQYRFNSGDLNDQSISARDFIQYNLQDQIMELISEEAKSNQDFVSRECIVTPIPFVLNQFLCKQIMLTLQFKFQKN